MNRVIIDLNALRKNLDVIDPLIRAYGADWSVVTKAISGHPEILQALLAMGVRSFNDTRLDNIELIETLSESAGLSAEVECWYMRPPHISAASSVVKSARLSLNSELATVIALNNAAQQQGLLHNVVAMVELGDLREGMPPGELLDFCATVDKLPNIHLAGIGGQVGCVSGLAPTPDHVAQLSLYRELIERRLGRSLPVMSGGSSMFLPMLIKGILPKGISHFRIGEALYLGSDLIGGGLLPGFNNDVIRLEAEVIEIKEKSLIPLGQTVEGTPFSPISEGDHHGMQRGYRALIAVGQLDTEISGLTPENPNYHISGASSDIAVINIGADPGNLKVGDSLRFKTSYGSFARLMSARYLDKVITPNLDTFLTSLGQDHPFCLDPVVANQAPKL